MSAKPFHLTLAQIRYGNLADELAEKLNELVLACDKTGKVGSLTMTLKLKPGKGGQMEISDDLKVKLPEFERGTTLMFPTPEGNLTREDPRQLKIDGLKSVDAPESTELKRVAQ